MRRSPGFAATIVLTLGCVIGANTAIFALIDAVMWRTLPVASPDTLVTVGDASAPTRLAEGGPLLTTLSYPLYARLRDRNDVVTLAATGRAGRVEMQTSSGTTENLRGRLVSANYFDVLGVPARVGRTFSADDDHEGAGPVVVLSDDVWSRRFDRDPAIVGRVITLNGVPFVVVGVGLARSLEAPPRCGCLLRRSRCSIRDRRGSTDGTRTGSWASDACGTVHRLIARVPS
jgi:hypothetical protein